MASAHVLLVPNKQHQAMYHQEISGETCPTTRPSLLFANNTTAIYQCTALLLNIDCKNDLGFGAGVGNAMSGYPETLYVREGF